MNQQHANYVLHLQKINEHLQKINDELITALQEIVNAADGKGWQSLDPSLERARTSILHALKE